MASAGKVKEVEATLWESADLLRAESKLTANQYCMPVLGLLFLRYAFNRFKKVEEEILKDRPTRNGRTIPIEKCDFAEKNALFLPELAQYEFILNHATNFQSQNLLDIDKKPLTSLGAILNNAMKLIESQSPLLQEVLPNTYHEINDSILERLLRIFNNDSLNEVGGDVFGRIYEYFLNKFAKNIAQDDGVFFTPKSLVKMIVNVLEPKKGILLDPACGSGGMFIQSGDFVNQSGINANSAMTFYGQEKVDYNAKLCRMNMAVHGLSGKITSGEEANSFYHDVYDLDGKCDYVMANPPFNVDKVNSENTSNAGRLPFGLPTFNKKNKEIGNANYLWISYFYSYLNEKGRAGFVMASSATDSSGGDKLIREQLVKTGNVDVMISVGNNFFYKITLPCSLWFFDKAKSSALKDVVLFIDARNYYTVVDRALNEWTEWQLKNLNCIVHLYRGEKQKYINVINDYCNYFNKQAIQYNQRSMAIILSECKKGSDFEAVEKAIFEELENVKNEQIETEKVFDQKIGVATKSKDKDAKKQVSELKRQKKDALNLLQGRYDVFVQIQIVAKEACWLYEKFGDGEYKDILGLCKIASITEIEQKNWSLTPGAYVGVAPVQDDGIIFEERMKQIHTELQTLQTESNELMQKITENMAELGL